MYDSNDLARHQQELAEATRHEGGFAESATIGALSSSVRDPVASQFHDEAILRRRREAERKLPAEPKTDALGCIEGTIRACEAAGLQSELPRQQTLSQLNDALVEAAERAEAARIRRILNY